MVSEAPLKNDILNKVNFINTMKLFKQNEAFSTLCNYSKTFEDSCESKLKEVRGGRG